MDKLASMAIIRHFLFWEAVLALGGHIPSLCSHFWTPQCCFCFLVLIPDFVVQSPCQGFLNLCRVDSSILISMFKFPTLSSWSSQVDFPNSLPSIPQWPHLIGFRVFKHLKLTNTTWILLRSLHYLSSHFPHLILSDPFYQSFLQRPWYMLSYSSLTK